MGGFTKNPEIFPFFLLWCFRHVISELKTYTQYLVSLQVINPKGAGPGSTVVVMTNEGGKIEAFPH